MGEDAAGSSNAAGHSKGKPARRVVTSRASARARSRTRSPSSSPPPAPHLLRRGHTGLISPPPSRRAPVVVPRPVTPPPEPVKEEEKGKALPERDSPNNPFLADDSPGSIPSSEVQSSPEPRTPKKHAEKPTLTYVLYVSFITTVCFPNEHTFAPQPWCEDARFQPSLHLRGSGRGDRGPSPTARHPS